MNIFEKSMILEKQISFETKFDLSFIERIIVMARSRRRRGHPWIASALKRFAMTNHSSSFERGLMNPVMEPPEKQKAIKRFVSPK